MNKKLLVLGIVGACLGLAVWFSFSGSSNNAVVQNIQPRSNTASAVTVIAFGDSLTAGFGLSQNDTYPAQLETLLQSEGYDVSVINAGVSGETTRGNLERANFITRQTPDVVILGIGGNDALRLLNINDTRKNLTDTIAILQSGETVPVIMLLQMQAPLTAGLGYKREFDAMYEDIATEKGLLLVPFLTTELFLDTDNKLSDGIHYNALGYKKAIDQHIAPALREVLDRL